MPKRTFLMLAHNLNLNKHKIACSFVSAKLDGHRAFWDGGISRGLSVSEVPYANRIKDARLKKKPVATGLWSRQGKVIYAPDWFLDKLPLYPLDGELYMGVNTFQKLTSCVKNFKPGDDWQHVKYMVFDSPSYASIFKNGDIGWNDLIGCVSWAMSKSSQQNYPINARYDNVYDWLSKFIPTNNIVKLIHQEHLSSTEEDARDTFFSLFKKEVSGGGEGVMVRLPGSAWEPHRSHSLLKYKPRYDAEGIVVGFQFGRETDRGSKLLGKMGALQIKWNGKKFFISGFTDEERELKTKEDTACAVDHPGEIAPKWAEMKHFPIGTKVTFKYRVLSDDGVPKEAQYCRIRRDI